MQPVPSLRSRLPWASAAKRPASAFSLIELLIVMALILILTVMYHGGGSRRVQNRAKQACQRNLVTLHLAMQLYANDHTGAFPAVPGATTAEQPMALLIPKYISTTAPFVCPGSKDQIAEGDSLKDRRISYAYFTGLTLTDSNAVLASDRQVDTTPKLRGHAVFSADGKGAGNNHRQFGGNLLFVDGHVESITAVARRDYSPSNTSASVTMLNPRAP